MLFWFNGNRSESNYVLRENNFCKVLKFKLRFFKVDNVLIIEFEVSFVF